MMARAPERTCPSLYRLIEHAEPRAVLGFLREDEFARQQWLKRYSEPDDADRALFEKLLQEKKKTRLDPLEREASKIVLVSETRGQYALDGLVRTKLKPEAQQAFRLQKDDLSRSLWTYSNHRLIFDAVVTIIHRRLYRTYCKHYQAFQPGGPVGRRGVDFEKVKDTLLREIEGRLDMGEGSGIERFDIPADGGMPAAEMYIIYHPNPPTSAREIREDGERRTIYFRPPGEATVVFTPSTGTIEVRGDTRIIRKDVAESFAKVVLRQDLSSKPLEFREYDLSRFFDSFSLDIPVLDGFHIRSARVIRADISVGHLGNRLSLSTTIEDDIDQLIDRQSGLRQVFRRAIAIRFIEIAVRYVPAGEVEERTLDFTISDQNSCSLLSLPEERDRVLGHRLLRHWEILTEFDPSERGHDETILPVILEIWDSNLDTVTGSWLHDRGIDEASLTSLGFLVPVGWEETDLEEEDHIGLVAGTLFTDRQRDGDRAFIQFAEGQEGPAGDARRYRKFRVDQDWMVEHLRTVLADVLDDVLVEVLSPDLAGLGSFENGGSRVPVYLTRRLDDPKVLADSDHLLRSRANLGIGLVLCAAKGPFRCLAANVLCAVSDLLSGTAPSIEALRAAYRNNRALAHGGQAVELAWDGGEAGELFVPGKGSIQISGHNRLVVIDRLVRAYRSGPSPLKTGDLRDGFGGQQLPSIFGKALWERLNGTFVRSPDYGLWEIAA